MKIHTIFSDGFINFIVEIRHGYESMWLISKSVWRLFRIANVDALSGKTNRLRFSIHRLLVVYIFFIKKNIYHYYSCGNVVNYYFLAIGLFSFAFIHLLYTIFILAQTIVNTVFYNVSSTLWILVFTCYLL